MARRCWAVCAVVAVSGALACATGPRSGRVDPTADLEMVPVKGGCFSMGNVFEDFGQPEERPVHEVCVGDFSIGKYEVTQGQWKAVMGTNPSANVACGDRCPVEMVSWNDAQAFIRRLNKLSSRGKYRLPTEAEWEYVARSGGKRERHSGRDDENVHAIAWFCENSKDPKDGNSVTGSPQPVGQKAPNGLGVHDMTGNVWEWTADWYGSTYYASSPRENPAGPATGERRVIRGGGFSNEAFDLRTTYRNNLPPDYRGRGTGFRLVKQ